MSESRSGKEQPIRVKRVCRGSGAGRAPRVHENSRRAGWLGRSEQEVRAGEEGGEATRVKSLNSALRAVKVCGPRIAMTLSMFLEDHFNGRVKINYL